MYKEIIEKKHYCFYESFDTWHDAIVAAAQPLIADKSIDITYVNSIIECIKLYGPYIVIAPRIALPHSTMNHDGVKKTTLSFMKVNKPVVFDESDREKDASVFLTLAANNNEDHLKMMSKLATLLMNEKNLHAITEIENSDQLEKLLKNCESF